MKQLKHTHSVRHAPRWLGRILILAALLGLHAAPARAQDILLAINPQTSIAAPGDSVVFTGSVGNPNSEDVTVTSFSFATTTFTSQTPGQSNAGSDLLFQDFLAPFQLSSGQNVFLTNLFSVSVDPNAFAGIYSGTFSLTYSGDVSGDTYSSADVPFVLTVAPAAPAAPAAVPEPSAGTTFAVMFAGVGALCARRRRRLTPGI